MSTPIQKKYRFSPLSYYEIPKLTFYFLLHCRCLIVFPTGLAKLVVQSAQKIYICWAVRKSKRFKDWSKCKLDDATAALPFAFTPLV